MKKLWVFIVCISIIALVSCCGCSSSSTTREARQQEKLSNEAFSETGMPNIKNFRERKLLKDIYELRDQAGLTTYTYLFNQFTGKLIFLGESIGYGIPYATEYTNPERVTDGGMTAHTGNGNVAIPQADPNGLYSPSSAEGTWVLLKDPNGKDVKPVYIEPRIIVSPFKLKEGD